MPRHSFCFYYDPSKPVDSHQLSVRSRSLLFSPNSGAAPSPRLASAAGEKAPSSSSDANEKVLELLDLVNSTGNNNVDQQVILNLLESLAKEDQNTSFTNILGNYNVTYVIPSKPNERPVGGKWSKGPSLLKTQRTLQHLLPPIKKDSVAQAVNVISLTALWFHIHVILRGDAYAMNESERTKISQERQTPGGLSARTVRADFDPPRIVVVRGNNQRPIFNMNLGPPSSVILDTPYCDDIIRLGKGSKGSWFVFRRCHDVAASEWKQWIDQRPLQKSTAMGILAGCIGVGTGRTTYRGACACWRGCSLHCVTAIGSCRGILKRWY